MPETTEAHSSEVLALRRLTPTILEVRAQKPAHFSHQAGQYVMLGFPPRTATEPIQLWPMALASAPEQEVLEFCIRHNPTSKMAPYLEALKEGDALQLKGPFGSFLYQSKPGRALVMIASGTGLAPLRAMLHSQALRNNAPASITLLVGARNEQELLYQDELSAHPGLHYLPVLSQPTDAWSGARGRVTDWLASTTATLDWERSDFYLCGHVEMERKVEALLLQRRVPPTAIFAA